MVVSVRAITIVKNAPQMVKDAINVELFDILFIKKNVANLKSRRPKRQDLNKQTSRPQ